MKWIEQIVDEILKNFPDKEIYTCASGLSTTGISHIGNFRELITTYFIVKELEKRGKKVRFILSFDDFDRLKKVPYGVDNSFSKYIGMPNSLIPSPFNDGESYAEHFESLVKGELSKLGIFPEYIRQSQKYLSHTYDEYIKLALNHRYEIFDVISKHKTQKLTEFDKENYYPVKVYCENCGKDSTCVVNCNLKEGVIDYRCKCGMKGSNKIENLQIKLNFNIDWPMRWKYEHVNFELCGIGHADPNGALNISKEISRLLFDDQVPLVKSYEFVKCGNKGRMNKNSKDLITVTKLLEIMPKEMILWIFLSNNITKEIHLTLDKNTILNLYSKFESILTSDDEKSERVRNMLNLDFCKEVIKFSDLLKYLPACNFNILKLQKYINIDFENKNHLFLVKYACKWLNEYCENKYWQINEQLNFDYWENMCDHDRKVIECFVNVLSIDDCFENVNNFINKKKEDGDLVQFYKNFYNLVFNSNNGIRFKTILENFNIDEIFTKLNSYVQLNCSNNKVYKKKKNM